MVVRRDVLHLILCTRFVSCCFLCKMEFSVDEKNLKVEDRDGSDPAKEQRLKDIRQTFHPMFIPTLTVAEQRGPTEVTFHLKNEDHTLCNPLREVLNRHPAVLHVGKTLSWLVCIFGCITVDELQAFSGLYVMLLFPIASFLQATRFLTLLNELWLSYCT